MTPGMAGGIAPASSRLAQRLVFYYALLGLLTWQLAASLWATGAAWSGGAHGWQLIWAVFVQNVFLCMLVLEAALIWFQEGSLSRSSAARLLWFNPSREMDLFYLNLYMFLSPLLMGSGFLRAVFPLVNFAGLPFPVGGLAFFLLSSFLQFFVHFLSHRIPALWELHKVHHSATELDVATGMRDHLFLWLVNTMVMQAVAWPIDPLGTLFMAFAMVTGLLQHSYLDFRLGWLGHVIISPHAHRIHHLNLARYHGRNFGSSLTLWDRLFGTFVYEAPIPAEEMNHSFGLPPGEPAMAETALSGLLQRVRSSLRRLRRLRS